MAKAQLEVPGSEVPEVQELAAKLAEAQAELHAAEQELNRLARIFNPPAASSVNNHHVSEIDVLRAKQAEPGAQLHYMEARATVLELTPVYERARAEAVKKLTEAREKGRLQLLKQFAMALDAAAEIGERIREYDAQTVTLGGRPVQHPFPMLLDEPPYRWGEARRVRQEVEQLSH